MRELVDVGPGGSRGERASGAGSGRPIWSCVSVLCSPHAGARRTSRRAGDTAANAARRERWRGLAGETADASRSGCWVARSATDSCRSNAAGAPARGERARRRRRRPHARPPAACADRHGPPPTGDGELVHRPAWTVSHLPSGPGVVFSRRIASLRLRSDLRELWFWAAPSEGPVTS
jgi:hypothetical protein